MKKPRVAFYSFTSCEGCQLTLLECEEDLIDIVQAVDIVRFREASSYEGGELEADADVAFVEGSITTAHDEAALRTIRMRSKVVVAFGACAAIGGVNAVRQKDSAETARNRVYGAYANWIHTTDVRRVGDVIPVDYTLQGCPINKHELLQFLYALLVGRAWSAPTAPVCLECKLRENVCLYHKGQVCLGPVIRGGCDALCPAYGSPCDGCRGPAPDANFPLLRKVLAERGVSRHDMARKLDLFNALAVDGAARKDVMGDA